MFQSLSYLLDPIIIMYIFLGVCIGIIGGALPGISAVMTVAMLVPLTFTMDSFVSMAFLIGAFFGSMYGGAITAILLKIPGTPSAMATVLDGFPMAQKGEAGRAIGIATIASGLGGLVGAILLGLMLPFVGKVALNLRSQDYAILALLGILLISQISHGSLIKGLMGGAIGILISTVGACPMSAYPRFAFGSAELQAGLPMAVILIGVLGISHVFTALESMSSKVQVIQNIPKRTLPYLKDVIDLLPTIIRSGVIGVFLGAVPAVGTGTSAIIAYTQAKAFSKNPQEFGKGHPQGIAAAEAANNACIGGALVPMLTLGIPGDPITAVLIGGLILHGIRPGPMLMTEQMPLVSLIYLSLLAAVFINTLVGLFFAKYFAKVLSLADYILYPTIFILAIVGGYAATNSMFGVWVMIISGLVGYLFTKVGINVMSVALGLVLGHIFESNFRRSLFLSDGHFDVYYKNPISLTLLIVLVLVTVVPLLAQYLRERRQKDTIEFHDS